MRLCANENIAEDCVIRLRQNGHDVLWIREAAPGSPDSDVLARALAEGRLLITFDKDFGSKSEPMLRLFIVLSILGAIAYGW